MKKDDRALAPWIKRFLLDYLPGDRNFARNTQHSYRDAVRLLVVFASATLHRKPDELLVEDLGADLLRKFMRHLEETRKCSISTRNQRLAGVHTLARFIAERSPEHLCWCAHIRTVPFKKAMRRPVGYLEKNEIDALLDALDRTTWLGFRDHSCCSCTTQVPAPMRSHGLQWGNSGCAVPTTSCNHSCSCAVKATR